jgi:hypothetical protein
MSRLRPKFASERKYPKFKLNLVREYYKEAKVNSYLFAGQLNLIAPWPNKLKFLYLDSSVVLSTILSACAEIGTLISRTRGPAKGY